MRQPFGLAGNEVTLFAGSNRVHAKSACIFTSVFTDKPAIVDYLGSV